jgi:hypothetical protein
MTTPTRIITQSERPAHADPVQVEQTAAALVMHVEHSPAPPEHNWIVAAIPIPGPRFEVCARAPCTPR